MATFSSGTHLVATRVTAPVEPFDVGVVGGGQAGRAGAWHMRRAGLRFLALATAELGHAWRMRWESLRLFTPAEQGALPGPPFPPPAGTYPGKEAVAEYLRAHATLFHLPVQLDARATGLRRADAAFRLSTAHRTHTARAVIVATRPLQTPFIGVPPCRSRCRPRRDTARTERTADEPFRRSPPGRP